MRTLAFLLTLLLQAPSPSVDFDRIGPKVGETAPDFELRDQSGTSRKLSSLAGPKATMLVFYRSADW
jgi:cytochrome oxidase Cu insertion factor (SCO1/SenC/PrrC family)